jgi:fatty-acyl-CoA synthase
MQQGVDGLPCSECISIHVYLHHPYFVVPRTGDLLRRDKSGYWYFVDRIGDTFRWKGENVSTNEVAEVLSLYPGVQEVNVYGVEVPHTDGRACMVGMVINLKGQNASRDGDMTSFLKGFYNHAAAKLPGYAIPVFIRQLKEVAVTSTFKHQKVQLRKEGARLDKVAGDALFVLDMAQKTYVPLSKEKWDDLAIGNAKL